MSDPDSPAVRDPGGPPVRVALTEPGGEVLRDGIYRDPSVGRLSRLGLTAGCGLSLFCLVGFARSWVAALVFTAIAVTLLLVRRVLARPRLVVRPEGLVVIRRLGSRRIAWPDVTGAGPVPAPPPFAAVEVVLAIRDARGHEVRVSSLREAVGGGSGAAPRMRELAASLVARAEWSTRPVPVGGPD